MTKGAIQIHPIRSEKDYERAIARIGQLISAVPQSPEGEELDVLSTLVDAYEAKRYAMDAPDPVAAVEFRMEQQGLTRKDLEPMIGSRARVSEILNRKRDLTLAMIRRLNSDLGIPADSLIGSTKRGGSSRVYPGSAHKVHRTAARTTKGVVSVASRAKRVLAS